MKKMKLRERSGFATLGMRILYRLIYPFFHCKCEVPREVLTGDEPVVFIANHYNVFGPVSFLTSMPFNTCAWVNEELITPETTEDALLSGIQSSLPFLSEKKARKLTQKVSGLVCRVILRFGAIPVTRTDTTKFISTVRNSEKALEQGHHLTIFPEIGDPEYSLTSVTPFFPGFATLGRLYARRTGKKLRFYPVYIDEQHHVIRCGEPVCYEPENETLGDESVRVSEELNRRIVEMADAVHGLDQHGPSRMQKRILGCCNTLRFLLLIPILFLLGSPSVQPLLILYALSQGLLIIANQVLNTLSASNQSESLFSHALTVITSLIFLFHLVPGESRLLPLAWLLVLYGMIELVSNLHTYFHDNRCAGTNYFDMLSINLVCFIILKQLLHISLRPLIFHLFLGATHLFLVCAAGFTLTFNLRILMKR